MDLSVLIVEDCPVMRLVIKRTLEMSGLKVTRVQEAENGQEGLDRLQEENYTIVIADINMPVMSGETMLKKIRENKETSEQPVLIVSTESNKKRIQFINEMSSGFVHKPFTPETLKEKILKLLGESAITNLRPVAISGSRRSNVQILPK